VKSLEDLGLTVYYLSNPKDLDGLYENLEIVGQLTGRESEADALVETLQSRVQVVLDKLAPISSTITVFYELDGSDPAKPWTAGSGTFLSQLIGMAGGVNVADSMEGAYAQMSLEALLVENPSVILLGDAAYGVTVEQVAARPGWDGLQAVKDNKIYTFDDDLVSRPGPRLVDGLEMLAKLLRPELFQ
jgi:iron complex transport system substrate-binding protein